MAFKIPFPTLHKKKQQQTAVVDLGIPVFERNELTDTTLIGQGSYGKVFKAKRNGVDCVIKELISSSYDINNIKLFRKEAQLLNSLSGHENIIKLHGFNSTDNSMLLEYMAFEFDKIGIKHEPVFNLKQLLCTCDSVSDFDGFKHLQYFLATDIISATVFLHRQGVAHRDLKPDNILVTNQHYETSQMDYWSSRPIIAKLTDFGESRSDLVQTRSIIQTSTTGLLRGSPVYMSPEALCEQKSTVGLEDLKKMDIWSLGMVLYQLVNPNVKHPYAVELEKAGVTKDQMSKVKHYMSQEIRPSPTSKYKDVQDSLWAPINNAASACLTFNPTLRPDADAVLQNVLNGYVEIESMLINQESISEACDARIAAGDGVFSSQLSTTNACTFLALLIAHRVLSKKENNVSLSEITQDIILNFPAAVNANRSTEQNYGACEALAVLKSCMVLDNMEMNVILPSQTGKRYNEATTELCNALIHVLGENDEQSFCAVYTCPPFSFLICKPANGQLTVIDTHPMPTKVGGKLNGAVVTHKFSENAVPSIVHWLLGRSSKTNMTVYQELSVVSLDQDIQSRKEQESPYESSMGKMELPDLIDSKNGEMTSDAVNTNRHDFQKSSTVASQGIVPSPDQNPKPPDDDVFYSNLYDDNENDDTHAERLHVLENNELYPGASKGCNGDLVILSSSSESMTDSNENVTPAKKYGQKYINMELHPSKWCDCEIEHVTKIPFDVDGLRHFVVRCNEHDMMTKTKDGRNWGRKTNSTRKFFNGKRIITKCRGSPKCPSKTCPYLEKYGTANRIQFENKQSTVQCFTCGTPSEDVKCSAKKIWEYSKETNQVSVMHIENHTCVPRPLTLSKQDIRAEVEKHPGVKPSRLVNDKMTDIMSLENFEWEAVEKIAENFVDIKRIHNVRQEIKSEQHPVGEHFEALGIYKAKCDEKDPYFIYKINNRALNGKPSYVFKSSRDMAQLALEMDRDRDGILKDEFAHIDAKHDRCRGFKTLTLWTYHPVLRKVLCLGKMEIEEESSRNIVEFWTIFNEMLQELTGNKVYKFNPTGVIADEHHANWNSMKTVFGEELVKRSSSCEFHYKQSVQRHSRKLGEHAGEFIRKAEMMLQALTVADYNSAHNIMSLFVKTHENVHHWLMWWHQRRSHIFKAFKPCAAPASNLAEVGHSKMTSVGRNGMSLLEAARHDIASALSQSAELRLFSTGQSKGGRGVTSNQKRAKEYKAGLKRAHAYAAEIEEGIITSEEPVFVPAKGRHRPADVPKQKKQKTTGKKRAISQNEKRQADEPSVFYVKFFRTIINLKRCYGCKKLFKDKYKKEPKDLVLQHFCHRTYNDQDGNIRYTKDMQAAYFHLKLDCVRKIRPRMEISDIIINAEVAKDLTKEHKYVLNNMGMTV